MRAPHLFRLWRPSWRNYARLSQFLFGLGFSLASLGNASAQEPSTASEPGRGQEARELIAQQTAIRSVRPTTDLAADNLDHVAATVDQILEFLKRDAGLMVEFKRLLAWDAGAAGQLLDETDLTDAAVIERLNEDLRARVLATRLLQRYGYLQPRVNPDSDLAAEHSLVMQDRAYAKAHAVETNAEPRRLPPAMQTAACDPEFRPIAIFLRGNRIEPFHRSTGMSS